MERLHPAVANQPTNQGNTIVYLSIHNWSIPNLILDRDKVPNSRLCVSLILKTIPDKEV